MVVLTEVGILLKAPTGSLYSDFVSGYDALGRWCFRSLRPIAIL